MQNAAAVEPAPGGSISTKSIQSIGAGVTVFAIQLWFLARRSDMRSAASWPW